MLGAHRRQVLAHADPIEGMVAVVLAHQPLQIVRDLPAALQRGHQAALQGHFRQIAVDGLHGCGLRGDEILQRGGGQRSGASDILAVSAPQGLEPDRGLLALARRHVAARKLIGIALEGAGA